MVVSVHLKGNLTPCVTLIYKAVQKARFLPQLRFKACADMALKLPVLKVSTADLGFKIPGLTQIKWTDVLNLDKVKIGEGSFDDVSLDQFRN